VGQVIYQLTDIWLGFGLSCATTGIVSKQQVMTQKFGLQAYFALTRRHMKKKKKIPPPPHPAGLTILDDQLQGNSGSRVLKIKL
jgi:hypothetical protein